MTRRAFRLAVLVPNNYLVPSLREKFSAPELLRAEVFRSLSSFNDQGDVTVSRADWLATPPIVTITG